MRFIEPVILSGKHVALEPLAREHEPAIKAAAADGELWKLWYTGVPTPEGTAAWIDAALAMRDDLHAMPFIIRELATGAIVGSTRYFCVDVKNRRLEIGHTFYARRVQRTAINTECKLLLFSHAFETLKCIAVELRTSFFNFQSRRAIERLGAKQDGILRNHILHTDGTIRDSVVFSVIASEWPVVKHHLGYQLARPRS